MSLPPLIAALCRPRAFPGSSAAAELVQTHISYVFLTDTDVYKIKKPVRFSFLDFSTLELRRRFCDEEVRLNRRLAGDVYREVVGIRLDGTIPRFVDASDPSAVEVAVHMRRLPSERTLHQLLEHDSVSAAMLAELAVQLVAFHQRARVDGETSANGSPPAVRGILEDNYSNVARFRGITIDARDDDAIQSFSRAFLDDNQELFRRRQAEGRVRDCHGDLHAEHIYFTEPLVIVDCIEFNTRFRYCDVASDVAFLAMDIDFHGRLELTQHFVDRYVELSNDVELRRLLPFYQCYRAYVRGKVDSLRSLEPDIDEDDRKTAAVSARRHFDLAQRYTWSTQPLLVLIGGLSGTGKSAIAAALQSRTGFCLLSSDRIRKQLASLAPTDAARAYDTGLYAPAHSQRTYATLLERAELELKDGRGVIVDATFQRRRDRDEARSLAQRLGVAVLLIECRLAPDVIRQRLEERARRGDSVSDADWNIYLEQLRRLEPIAADEATSCLVLDTGAPVEQSARRVQEALSKRFAEQHRR